MYLSAPKQIPSALKQEHTSKRYTASNGVIIQ